MKTEELKMGNKLKIDKDELYHQYVTLGKSQKTLQQLFGCSYETIHKKLVKYNFHIRSYTENEEILRKKGYNHFGRKIKINLSKDAIDFLNGELLGDGSINDNSGCKKFNSFTASFRYGSKHKEYINYVSTILSSFGIEQASKIYKYTRTGKQMEISKLIDNNKFDDKLYTSYHYRSKSYLDLTDLYNKWYLRDFSFCPYCEILFHDQTSNQREWQRYTTCPVCNEHRLLKKVVPRDIKLTPITCRQWFIGDGNNNICNGGGILLCTLSFLYSDIEFLKTKLEVLGFKITIKNKNLFMKVKVARTFLKYIGECPVECYKYKWSDLKTLICNRYNFCPYTIITNSPKGIQKTIFEIIKDSFQKGNSYIKKKDIMFELKNTDYNLTNEKNYNGIESKLECQLNQALYQLTKNKKIKRICHGKYSINECEVYKSKNYKYCPYLK